MTSMFWGLRLEPGKRYTTTVDKSFHVSMAALDVMKSDKDIQTVMLEEGESNIPFILCNLQKPKVLQCPLDLNFVSGDRVTFFCRGGNATVHLTGYLVPPDEDDFGKFCEEMVEEEEDEVEEEEECDGEDALKKGKVNGLPLKRKAESLMDGPSKNKSPQISSEQDSDDSDEDEDDSQDDDDDEEDSEEDGEEELEDESEEESEVGEEEIKEESKEPTSPQGQKGKKEKNKVEKSGVVREEKKKELPKKEAVANKKDSTQKLEGGVVVKDIVTGTGALCKPGRMVTVYYTGRLKSNNKVFDSSLQGAGFKFRVGRGEVIKGWDIGISGMKVGGKRLITCPPSSAYGAKGSPPTIPPNSTLLFEVELKAVN